MKAVRKARDFIKRFDVALYVIAALLGVFLAAGAILRTAKIPSEHVWAAGKPLFWGMLVGAVFVPLYTLYKSFDAHFESLEKRQSQAARDLAIACQKVVSRIADACPGVSVNDLAAFIWLCREDGSFAEAARFYLPHHRKETGVTWGRGRGVAGTAWTNDVDLYSDLTPLVERLEDLDDAGFNRLPLGERLGLTATELTKTRDRAGVCAVRLLARGAKPKLAAMFVLEYTGASDFHCVSTQMQKRAISEILGGCEEVLTETGTL